MLKFFRKYSKWILAIGGSLLMVVFLLPQAVEQLGGGSGNRAVARFDGGTIRLMDLERARRELGVVGDMGLDLLGLIRASEEDQERYLAEHWLLLTEMADSAGLVGGPDDGRDFLGFASMLISRAAAMQYLDPGDPSLDEIAGMLSSQFRQEMEGMRSRIIAQGIMPESEVDKVLAKARGVLRMYELYYNAPALSDLEAQGVARSFLDQAGVDFAILRATRVVPQTPPPTDEEIREVFEKHRDAPRGSGEFGIGYRYLPAVRLEWLHINRRNLEFAATVDLVDANAHWRRNRDRFPGEWTEERPDVLREMRREKADEVIREIDRMVTAELRRSTMSLPEEGPYKRLPDDWDLQKPSLNALAILIETQVRDRFGFEIERPLVINLDRLWNIRDEFDRFEGFSDSVLRFGPQSVTVTDASFLMREFGEDSPFGLQAGLIYGPAVNEGTRDAYYFRINEVRRALPPESLDEVYAQARADAHRLRAYRSILDSKETLVRLVAEEGLEGVQAQFGIADSDTSRNAAVSRSDMRPYQAMDFNIQSVRDAILERAMTLDPTRPAEQLPIMDRTLVLPLPQAMAVGITVIKDTRPLTLELFRKRQDRAVEFARRDILTADVENWPFNWPSVRDRMGYRDLVRRGDEGEVEFEDGESF